jgi:uncharacterized protein
MRALRLEGSPGRAALFALSLFIGAAPAAAADPDAALVARIAAALDAVPAIDNHAHLLRSPVAYNAGIENFVPLLLRSTRPEYRAQLKEQFGVEWDPARAAEADAQVQEARKAAVQAAGGAAPYWSRHLQRAKLAVVLVNQDSRDGIDGQAMRWVPYGTSLAGPFPNEAYAARHPGAAAFSRYVERRNAQLWKEHGIEQAPVTLAEYLPLLDRILERFREQGAVAIKFSDAYHRTLRIADVPRARAEAVYGKGRSRSATREEYLELQDYLYRHVFRRCGELGLAVHIHSSHGDGQWLRLQESDVRHLEDVVSDPAFFKTNFVLIHGGAPWHEAAAYMAGSKGHVWIDLSAMPFLYPVPELATVLRKYLAFAPERTLFATDAYPMPTIPGSPETNHVALAAALRRALYLALAGMVADGMVGEADALRIGRGVLRDNARRLYKLP